MNSPESKARVWSKIFVYYALANIGTGLFTLLEQRAPSNLTLATGAMWSPAVAAFLTTWLFGGRIRDFAWGWGSGRYQWWAYFIPFLYAVPVYLVAWTTGLAGFFNPAAATKAAHDYGLSTLSPGVAVAIYALISLRSASCRRPRAPSAKRSAGAVSSCRNCRRSQASPARR